MAEQPDLWADLEWRGLIVQSTDPAALRSLLTAGPVTLYAGFDPSADSLQVGNLVPLLLLRRFQLAGHRPIAVVGGATGLIGDPSFKASERDITEAGLIAARADRFRAQLGRFLDLDGPSAALLVDNLSWTGQLPALTFLRDVGKHFTVNAMLAKDAVSGRIGSESGISFAEFSYALLQAHDYLHLYREHGCRLQVGGSDQWGNITSGLELIRRTGAGRGSAHGLTHPLLTTAGGEKFGKSEGNAIWLEPTLLSAYAFYQYWLNTSDADVVGFLKVLTFLSRERIEELESATAARPQAREAQRALARAMTELVHGAAETDRVEAASRALFGRGELGELTAAVLTEALAEAPSVTLPAGPLPSVADLLVATGLVASRNEARRTIAQGGAYLNNRRVDADADAPDDSDLLHQRFLVLRRGTKALALVERRG